MLSGEFIIAYTRCPECTGNCTVDDLIVRIQDAAQVRRGSLEAALPSVRQRGRCGEAYVKRFGYPLREGGFAADVVCPLSRQTAASIYQYMEREDFVSTDSSWDH